MGGLFDTRLYRTDTGLTGHPRLAEILARGDHPGGHGEILGELADAVASADPGLPLDALIQIARRLADDPELDQAAHLEFWAGLARRLPDSGAVLACHGDILLDAGHRAQATGALLDALDRDRGLLDTLDDDVTELAREQGGPLWLRFELIELHAALDHLAGQSESDPGSESDSESDPDPDGDIAASIRERYSELLEEHDSDPDDLSQIRDLGKRIRQLEDSGVLPRAFMRRGSWREGSR